jgi:hypothetical protein
LPSCCRRLEHNGRADKDSPGVAQAIPDATLPTAVENLRDPFDSPQCACGTLRIAQGMLLTTAVPNGIILQ